MQVIPYLNFQGDCEEALALYEKVLGATIKGKIKFGETPMAEHVPPGQQDKIINVMFEINGHPLMASDCPPEHYTKPTGISVCLTPKTPEEAKRIFDGLSEGATITMPLEKTFWSPSFGMLTDRFGTPWMISTEPEGEGCGGAGGN